jgi:hypothetical protein
MRASLSRVSRTKWPDAPDRSPRQEIDAARVFRCSGCERNLMKIGDAPMLRDEGWAKLTKRGERLSQRSFYNPRSMEGPLSTWSQKDLQQKILVSFPPPAMTTALCCQCKANSR